jgi:hypothetical protein
VGIGNVDVVQVAVERGLIGCAGMEGDFDAAGLSRRVVVDVEVGGLVEAMKERPWSRRIEVGMSVDVPRLRSEVCTRFECGSWSWTHTVASISSPGKGGMVVGKGRVRRLQLRVCQLPEHSTSDSTASRPWISTVW